MKIEAGKYYRTRGGQVFGPMVRNPEHDTNFAWCLVFSEPENSWTEVGRWSMNGKLCLFDLVAEVHISDTPPDVAPAPEAKTLRDEFAMEALPISYDYIRIGKATSAFNRYVLAATAYDFADAMMEARKK